MREGDGKCEMVETSKKGRHRKKQLYNLVLKQMEFYFSDSNLSKDRFLSQLISKDPYVDVNVFLNFNKIRKLNCTLDDICKAISKSDLIELSSDKKSLKRKTEIKVKDNIDDCTIYVENIKADADHDFLSQVFSEFGKVSYVSIPKYKHNKANKGFAFIEFESIDEAQNALKYFESIGCKMPADTDPVDLTSIKTFKAPEDCLELKSDELDTKKRKLSTDTNEITKKIKIKHPVPSIQSEDCGDNHGAKNNEQEDENIKQNTNSKKRKKTKGDKRKSYIKELGLQILSRKEWKKMRNCYLDLQKKKMREFKQYIHAQRKKEANERNKKNEGSLQTLDSENESAPAKLIFQSGVIVKLKLKEPYTDVKKLKNEIKGASSDIKYVDIPPFESDELFIRFSNNESAKAFCNEEFMGEKTLLEGDEEKMYWDRIQNDRITKFNKTSKKQRGRQKLLKKAEKERAKHIRFDEAE